MQNNAKGAGSILSLGNWQSIVYSALTRILFYSEGGNHCISYDIVTHGELYVQQGAIPRKMKSTKVQTLGAKRARCSVDVSHV
jgi:hypothetical protein